jgi:hypothetical protein
VWTGSEMIIWGGQGDFGLSLDSGRYNPAADSWANVATNGMPAGRWRHIGIWTGREMIVWGGFVPNAPLRDGGRYDPQADIWMPMTTNGAPARYWPAAVWTGSEMIVWGGSNGGSDASNLTNTWLYRPNSPHLFIAAQDDEFVLAWPFPSVGFALESIAGVGETNWTEVPNAPVTVGNQRQVTVDSSAQNFYRLRKL